MRSTKRELGNDQILPRKRDQLQRPSSHLNPSRLTRQSGEPETLEQHPVRVALRDLAERRAADVAAKELVQLIVRLHADELWTLE